MDKQEVFEYVMSTPDNTNPAILREMLDNIGGGSLSAPMIEITYSDLKELRDSGELIPGTQYRIIDYETIINGIFDISEMYDDNPTYLHYARSAGHQFDIIVVADSETTLNENARAILHDGDTYFINSNLGAWKLKYALDNDSTKYSWADTANGKGVITFMCDEYDNEAGYDFKNIQFLCYALKKADPEAELDALCYGYDSGDSENSVHYQRFGSVYYVFCALENSIGFDEYYNPFENSDYDFYCGANILNVIQFTTVDTTYLTTFNAGWYYTFDCSIDGEIHSDYSLNSERINCYGNKIRICQDAFIFYWDGAEEKPFILGTNINVWENENNIDLNSCNELSYNNCMNIFGAFCSENIFGYGCCGNIFGNSYINNIFKYRCIENIFIRGCCNNTLGNECNDNRFGNYCQYNTFGNSCGSNTFGNSCYSNTFGNNCDSNTFGNNCCSNTFGNYYDSNTFGNDCGSNTFGANDNNNNFVGNMWYLHCGDHVQDISASSTQYGVSSTTVKTLENYNGTSGYATLIVKTGYNTETAVSTTDGGTTWT